MTITADDIARWIDTGIVPTESEIGMIDWRDPRYVPRFDLAVTLSSYQNREEAVRRFGFAIPCAEALDAIAALSPLVEVGAGTGYWSALLTKRGADIIATDITANGYSFAIGSVIAIETLDAVSAVQKYPDRNVLAVWPCYTSTWATECATAMASGRTLALVSEWRGGCVADDSLFDLLESGFEEVADIALPVWDGMHDRLTIHPKK